MRTIPAHILRGLDSYIYIYIHTHTLSYCYRAGEEAQPRRTDPGRGKGRNCRGPIQISRYVCVHFIYNILCIHTQVYIIHVCTLSLKLSSYCMSVCKGSFFVSACISPFPLRKLSWHLFSLSLYERHVRCIIYIHLMNGKKKRHVHLSTKKN